MALFAGLVGLSVLLLGLLGAGPAVASAVRLDGFVAQRAASTLGAGAVIATALSLGILVAYVIS